LAEPLKVLLFFGTRPEAIKLAPVILNLRENPRFVPIVCTSGQHRALLHQALTVFSIVPDHDLGVMVPGQSLFYVTRTALARFEPVLRQEQPDLVIVQGDAQTAFVGALAAYYSRIPVVHVEAGLRTGDPYAPFPEEMNRRLIDRIAALLFAPTAAARRNLLAEGISDESIVVTGNTEIDALLYVRKSVPPRIRFDLPGRIVLVTAHRRESFSGGIARICRGLRRLAERNREITIVYSVHPNPHVSRVVRDELSGAERVTLIDPPDYASFVHLMADSALILTDSGGIQEAGAALHVPVLVLRERTERTEGLETGAARLVGTDPERIVAAAEEILSDPAASARMREARNPYGDGNAAAKIVRELETRFT